MKTKKNCPDCGEQVKKTDAVSCEDCQQKFCVSCVVEYLDLDNNWDHYLTRCFSCEQKLAPNPLSPSHPSFTPIPNPI